MGARKKRWNEERGGVKEGNIGSNVGKEIKLKIE